MSELQPALGKPSRLKSLEGSAGPAVPELLSWPLPMASTMRHGYLMSLSLCLVKVKFKF